jgi:hypothetical protein
MINELNTLVSFVSSVPDLTSLRDSKQTASHIGALDILRSRITEALRASKSKAEAVLQYVKRMQQLDNAVSVVIHSPENNGDISGTIGLLSSSIRETNLKQIELTTLIYECDQLQRDIEEAKTEIRERAKALDDGQKDGHKVYLDRHLHERKVR